MIKEAIFKKSTLSFDENNYNKRKKGMSSCSGDVLVDAILSLLTKCTGVPASSLPHELKAIYPTLDLDTDDTDLQTTVFELFGNQKINLETWFIQENLAENYILSWCVVENEDLVRPSRNFIRQPFPDNHHCEVTIYKNIEVDYFYFALKSTSTEPDELEELIDKMQDAYPAPQKTPLSPVPSNCPPLLPTLATGVLCAVLNHQQWARGRIISVEQNMVKVDLVDDCGSLKIALPTSNIRILLSEFRDVPRRKLGASFCTSDISAEEATNNRVLLAVHRNWRAYRVDRVSKDSVDIRPEYSFLANLRINSDDPMTSTTQTLIFYPVFEEKPGAVR